MNICQGAASPVRGLLLSFLLLPVRFFSGIRFFTKRRPYFLKFAYLSIDYA